MDGYLAYIRVSTVKQGEHGTSLDEQRSAIEAYASRHALPITAWFEEMETAAKQGRQQFTHMLAELNKGRAQGVIIHKIDRSARNLKDWARIGDLIDEGIDVRFAHESLDLSSRGGRLAADIQAVVAADFIRNHRQVVLMGFRGRLKQGLYPLGAPRGYLDQGKGKAKTIDPVRGPLVRRAFELYASGAYTFDTLKEELFRLGLRSKTGKPLSYDAVSTMLRNPFYVGLIRIAKTGEVFEGVHRPLIPKALFDRVQAIIDGRLSPRPNKHEFIFSRMIRCKACRYSLIGEARKGHAYYRCHTRTCKGTTLREQDIDRAVRERLAFLAFDEEELQDIRDLAESLEGDLFEAEKEHRSRIDRDLGLCEERLARLTDALIDGLVDKETFEIRKAGLFGERRALRDALELPDPVGRISDRVSEYLGRGNMAYLAYDSAFPDEKRQILRELTSDFVARGKTLEITMRNAFQAVLEWRISQSCAPHRDSTRIQGVSFDGVSKSDVIQGLIATLRQLDLNTESKLAHCSNGSRVRSITK